MSVQMWLDLLSVRMSVPRWMGTGLVEAKGLELDSGWVLE